MGWTLTGVVFRRNGQRTRVHADGNNLAWSCDHDGCVHPVLFIYLNGRIGSGPAFPSPCPACGATYSLAPAFDTQPQPPKGVVRAPATHMDIV